MKDKNPWWFDFDVNKCGVTLQLPDDKAVRIPGPLPPAANESDVVLDALNRLIELWYPCLDGLLFDDRPERSHYSGRRRRGDFTKAKRRYDVDGLAFLRIRARLMKARRELAEDERRRYFGQRPLKRPYDTLATAKALLDLAYGLTTQLQDFIQGANRITAAKQRATKS